MRYIVRKGKRYLILCVALLAGVGCVVGMFGGVALGRTVQAVSQPRHIPIYSVETDKKQVALGINCAWDNADIPSMLDTLDKYDVKATFFILGEWSDKYPESVLEIHSRGHEIASHSNTHRDWDTLSKADIERELTEGMGKLESITGEKPQLVRPPSGAYNNLSVSTAEEMGYYVIQWDCDSLDWKGLSAEEIVQRVTEKTGKGSITLLHSGAKNTATALPALIESLQGEEYELVKVGEMIHRENYTIDHAGKQIAGNKPK